MTLVIYDLSNVTHSRNVPVPSVFRRNTFSSNKFIHVILISAIKINSVVGFYLQKRLNYL